MGRRRGLLHPQGYLANVGDIAYKASNGKVMVVALDLWDASLGTPVGVVVIPSGFAPDNGKARIISLNWASASVIWGPGTDTSLTNRDTFPVTDNMSANNTGYSYDTDYNGAVLPIDAGSGAAKSFVDPEAYYQGNPSGFSRAPSPYLGDAPNPAYYAEISGYNNVLSDFNGKGNTEVLVALGSAYAAANSARNYLVDGAEDIEWYLPAAGELGYLVPRFYKINSVFKKLGGDIIPDESGNNICFIWSSTEAGKDYALVLTTYIPCLDFGWEGPKSSGSGVRPFAQLDF